jgi:hypothetical protein
MGLLAATVRSESHRFNRERMRMMRLEIPLNRLLPNRRRVIVDQKII